MTPQMAAYAEGIWRGATTAVMGRTNHEGFQGYWPSVAAISPPTASTGRRAGRGARARRGCRRHPGRRPGGRPRVDVVDTTRSPAIERAMDEFDGVGDCPRVDVPLETAQLIRGFSR